MFQTCNLRHFSPKETYSHWCKINWQGQLCLGVWVLAFSVTASGEESGSGLWIIRTGSCRILPNPTETHFLPPIPLVPATRTENSPANAVDTRDAGSIPGLGRSPGIGNGNPLQYSCLGNAMDRGAWRAIGKASEMTEHLSTPELRSSHKSNKKKKKRKSEAWRTVIGECVPGYTHISQIKQRIRAILRFSSRQLLSRYQQGSQP